MGCNKLSMSLALFMVHPHSQSAPYPKQKLQHIFPKTMLGNWNWIFFFGLKSIEIENLTTEKKRNVFEKTLE